MRTKIRLFLERLVDGAYEIPNAQVTSFFDELRVQPHDDEPGGVEASAEGYVYTPTEETLVVSSSSGRASQITPAMASRLRI